ncbi:MAG: hypothetical protein AAGU25_00915 [bacterium]
MSEEEMKSNSPLEGPEAGLHTNPTEEVKEEISEAAEPLKQELKAEAATPEKPFITPEEEKPKKPGIFTRLHRWWFNKDSKFGRFNQKALRVLTAIAVLFAIGFAVCYFVLYRPATQDLQAMADKYVAQETQYTQSLKDVTAQAEEIVVLSAEVIQLNDQLEKEKAHMDILRLETDLMEAKYYIADDSFSSARTSLESAKTRLEGLEKMISATDAELYKSLMGRLTQAISDLSIKSANTATDITMIVNQLREFETKSFGSEE